MTTIGTAELPDRDLLRVVACGSVDDGKSTLIGRLLYDVGAVPADVHAALVLESAGRPALGGVDYALLTDGLEAEREQGITVDVAFRFFSTDRRAFILADAPGHEQYTRNMAVGASTADLAILLIDARQGLLAQTRRHAAIVSMFGVRHVALAVNKMDLVDWDEGVFQRIVDAFHAFAAPLAFTNVHALPVCAPAGDNLRTLSPHAPWFTGAPLLAHLETVEGADRGTERPFRFPVQSVVRPDADFRGLAGTVASGTVAVGDTVIASLSGRPSVVTRVVAPGGDVVSARAGEATTLVLDPPIDVARGDLLSAPGRRPIVARRLSADLLWMHDAPLRPGARLLLRQATRTTPVRVTTVTDRLRLEDLKREPTNALGVNDIGMVVIEAQEALAFDPYVDNRRTGAFLLVDPSTSATLAAGLVLGVVDQPREVHPQTTSLHRVDHERLNGHRSVCVWITGLSGAGKSTLADALQRHLHSQGVRTALLDGDNLRLGLNRDLGFDPVSRAENVRRTAEAARLFVDAGVVAICALISPAQAARDAARALFAGDFFEVFVDTAVEVCAARDPKGLYARARRGEIADFTQVSASYERPVAPELILSMDQELPDAQAAVLAAALTITPLV